MPVRARIQNYQSLADVVLTIDRLTVVTGSNNAGKSAVIRAIRGVFQNTGGTAFIRHGESQCKVTLDFGQGQTLEWSKGIGKRDRPTYRINGGPPLHPGSAVPEEVAAFGVVPIVVGGQEVWPTIASQFTGQVFLLDRPGSALAEAVADVERVGQLNRALRKAESDRRQTLTTLKIREADQRVCELEVQRFQGLDKLLEGIETLGKRQTHLDKIQRALERLGGMHTSLGQAQRHVRFLTGVAGIQPPTTSAGALLREKQALVGLQTAWRESQKELVRLQGVESLKLSVSDSTMRRRLAAREVVRQLAVSLKTAQEGLESLQRGFQQAQKEWEEASAQFALVLAELGSCPLCGKEVAE